MQFWEQIRGAVRSACVNQRVTQTEIGRRAGMSRAAISNFMCRTDGGGLTPKNLDRLLRALRLRVEVLRK